MTNRMCIGKTSCWRDEQDQDFTIVTVDNGPTSIHLSDNEALAFVIFVLSSIQPNKPSLTIATGDVHITRELV